MVKQTPKIDSRTAADIEQQVRALLKHYAANNSKEFSEALETEKPQGISTALIKIHYLI